MASSAVQEFRFVEGNSSRVRAEHIDPAVWESHRQAIAGFYNDHTATQLLGYMKEQLNFTPSRRQVISQLSKWDLSKYKTKMSVPKSRQKGHTEQSIDNTGVSKSVDRQQSQATDDKAQSRQACSMPLRLPTIAESSLPEDQILLSAPGETPFECDVSLSTPNDDERSMNSRTNDMQGLSPVHFVVQNPLNRKRGLQQDSGTNSEPGRTKRRMEGPDQLRAQLLNVARCSPAQLPQTRLAHELSSDTTPITKPGLSESEAAHTLYHGAEVMQMDRHLDLVPSKVATDLLLSRPLQLTLEDTNDSNSITQPTISEVQPMKDLEQSLDEVNEMRKTHGLPEVFGLSLHLEDDPTVVFDVLISSTCFPDTLRNRIVVKLELQVTYEDRLGTTLRDDGRPENDSRKESFPGQATYQSNSIMLPSRRSSISSHARSLNSLKSLQRRIAERLLQSNSSHESLPSRSVMSEWDTRSGRTIDSVGSLSDDLASTLSLSVA